MSEFFGPIALPPNPIDSCTVKAIVVFTKWEQQRDGAATMFCNAAEMDSGIIIEKLPCAGMGLKPGDCIALTVQRIPSRPMLGKHKFGLNDNT